jgi:oxygen-dependent protoporphyrinogen oxidase
MHGRRVLVVGGGIAGLAAAARLAGVEGVDIELWEASERLGGKIATSPFAGVDRVDEGADAYLTRVPHAVDFARRVGLTADDLTAPASATAAVWHGGRLHDIPGGVMLGVPAALRPFVTSSLLSWSGKLRAAAEPLLPRTDPDDSIGRLIRARFGREVHERLVDALIGSIYATDTDRASLAAVPQLGELAARHRSLLLGARAARRVAGDAGSDGAIFAAPLDGVGALVDAAERWLTGHGVAIRLASSATSIAPDGDGWRVDDTPFDGVVFASPASAAAQVLASAAPEAARGLARFETADVIMVRLAVAGTQWPERLRGRSGYLVPKPAQRTVTAVSFGSQKWPHWCPADGSQILRVSLGRDGLPVRGIGDDAALGHAIDEVGSHLGIDLAPVATSVTRWEAAFPQYRPHHHEQLAAIERSLPATIALAGASYRGIGIPACIADGERAAATVLGAIDGAERPS